MPPEPGTHWDPSYVVELDSLLSVSRDKKNRPWALGGEVAASKPHRWAKTLATPWTWQNQVNRSATLPAPQPAWVADRKDSTVVASNAWSFWLIARSKKKTHRFGNLDKGNWIFHERLNDRYKTPLKLFLPAPSGSPCWRVLGTKGSCYAHVFAMPIPWSSPWNIRVAWVLSLGFYFKKIYCTFFFLGGVHQNSETAILRLLFLDLRKAPQNPGAGTLGLWSLSNFPPKKAGNQREPLSQRSVMPLPKPLRPLARIAQKSPHMRFSSRWGRWLEKDSIRDFKRWTFVCCQPWRNEFYHIK